MEFTHSSRALKGRNSFASHIMKKSENMPVEASATEDRQFAKRPAHPPLSKN
jgi:hypothetical protein